MLLRLLAHTGECGVQTRKPIDPYRRISARIIPLMMLLYLMAFLDRVNIGFAALTMNQDLGLSASVYGWGAGIFFLGYFLFEVPSNLILEKVGARLWIARIMITWGLISAAMAFVTDVRSFLALRLLLGIAEAGFLPGMLLYLTYWFPARHRARYVALFMAAVPLASAIGAPISGLLVDMPAWLGLKGWQWLFIVEGLPSCLLGVVVWFALPDGPARARWLSEQERAMVQKDLAEDRRQSHPHTVHAIVPALLDRRVLMLGGVYFGIVIALYGIGLWLPQITRAMGYSNVAVGLIIAIPYAASAAAMLAWGRHSDRSGERARHVAIAAVTGIAGFAASLYFDRPGLVLCGLGLASVGIYACLGPFWAMPSRFLQGSAAAGGIALINSVGNLGGFAGPYLMGWIKEHTGSFSAGIVVLACALAASALLVLALRQPRAPLR